MTTPYLESDLIRDEGVRTHAYKDSLGLWTCGVGHHDSSICPDTVWTLQQCMAQLQADIAEKKAELDKALPWWRQQTDARQDAMVNLAFMGLGNAPSDGKPGRGLLSFVNTLAEWKCGNYAAAAAGILDSKYAAQVGDRAKRIARLIETGVRPELSAH